MFAANEVDGDPRCEHDEQADGDHSRPWLGDAGGDRGPDRQLEPRQGDGDRSPHPERGGLVDPPRAGRELGDGGDDERQSEGDAGEVGDQCSGEQGRSGRGEVDGAAFRGGEDVDPVGGGAFLGRPSHPLDHVVIVVRDRGGTAPAA